MQEAVETYTVERIMSNPYFLKLNQFEGPLDLLLHLIKVNEIDIFNIDIFLLTSQYLDYLRLLKFQDLGDAAEFLEMAATLIEIKSRMLLPHTARRGEGDFDEDDPRRSLQERLIEYERIRQASEHLGARPMEGLQIQVSQEWQRLEPTFSLIEAPLTGDPMRLVVLYEQMLREFADRKPTVKVTANQHVVTVEEKAEELQKLLGTVNFALFQGFYPKFQSRYELVVYILAVLELSRWGKLKVYQQELLGPLWIYRIGYDEALLPLTSEERQKILRNAVPEATPAHAPETVNEG